MSANTDIDLDIEPFTAVPKPAVWAGVVAMMLGVTALLTAELLPASVLTPMAQGLGVTTGVAGQAVTATAFAGLIGALLSATVTRRFNRKPVLLAFSLLLIVSNLLAAVAPNIELLLAARIVLGLAIGGFWTMAAATTIRMVPEAMAARAIAIVMSGIPAAMIIAIPVGGYLSDLVNWRVIFALAAALGALVLVLQMLFLPRVAPKGHASLAVLGDIISRPGIGFGFAAAILVFTGHFGYFTYIRPYLETVTTVNVGTMAMILFVFGVGSYVGTFVSGAAVERSLKGTLIVAALGMGVLGLLLAAFGGALAFDTALIVIWGVLFGAVPVAFTTWITRAVPDEVESATGLLVALIFVGIAAGAAGGGAIFDLNGVRGVFLVGGLALLGAAVLVAVRVQTKEA